MATSKGAIAPEKNADEAPVLGKHFPVYDATNVVARFPTLCLCVSFLPLLAIVLSGLAIERELGVSVGDFQAQGTEAAREVDAVAAAEARWAEVRTLNSFGRVERTAPGYRATLQVSSTGNGTVTTPRGLALLAAVEQAARGAKGYTTVCWTNNLHQGAPGSTYPPCAPVSSVTQYFYPAVRSKVAAPFYEFNGLGGTQQSPVATMLERLQLNPDSPWFFDAPGASADARAVRSQIILGTPLLSSGGGRLSQVSYNRYADDYLTALYDAVTAVPVPAGFEVTVGGERLVQARVAAAMDRSLWIQLLVLVVVPVGCFVHMRTLVVTLLATVQQLLVYSCGLILVSYTQSDTIPLLSYASVFVVVAFGVDGFLVFYDTFVFSGVMATSRRANTLTVAQRVAFLYRRAWTGVVLSHVVAACAIAPALLSALPALRTFAGHTLLVLLLDVYCFTTLCPAAIVFHHYHFSKRRRNLQRRHDVLRRRVEKGTGRPPALAALLRDVDTARSRAQTRRSPELQERAERWDRSPAAIAGVTAKLRRAIGDVIPTHAIELQVQRFQDVAYGNVRAPSPPPTPFDMDAFADAPTQPGTLYVTDKLLAPRDIIAVPPELCYRSDAASTAACRVLDSVATPVPSVATPRPIVGGVGGVGGVPMARPGLQGPLAFALSAAPPRATADTRPSTPPPSVGADAGPAFSPAEGRDQPAVTDAPAASNTDPPARAPPVRRSRVPEELRLPWLERPEDGEDAGFVERHAAACSDFEERWCRIALELRVLPGRAHAPELTALCAYRVARCLTDVAAAAACVYRQAPAPEHGVVEAPVELSDEKGPVERLQAWWTERAAGQVRRQWCFGRLGKRVEETREEKDARLLRKTVKHEGYGLLERALANWWPDMVHRARYPVVAAHLALIVLCVVGAALMPALSADVALLSGDDSGEQQFSAVARRFPVRQASCDTCGAYYRSADEFRPLTAATVAACDQQGEFAGQVNVFVDQCGACNGVNACVDCTGVPHGPYRQDTCGVCRLPNSTEWNSCTNCLYYPGAPEPRCQWCSVNRNILGGGPSCSVPCDDVRCPASRGRCNHVTGVCECHASYSRGFFTGDRCGVCVTGFGPAVGARNPCTLECGTESGIAENTACGACSAGRCTACAAGYGGAACTVKLRSVCDNGVMDDGVCECTGTWGGSACDGHLQCGYRGVYLRTDVAAVEGCLCHGNFVGPRCEFCACANGGTCHTDGTCTCKGVWSGPQCRECNGCSPGGLCPAQWAPDDYDYEFCMALYCPQEARASLACARCRRTRAGHCGVHDETNCDLRAECLYNKTARSCVMQRETPLPPNATMDCSLCVGYWTGPRCSVCTAPKGTVCDGLGMAVACDGLKYTVSQRAVVPVRDACGVCGGNGACVGCDGVLNSSARYDACGVCGGDGDCGSREPVTLVIMVGATGLALAQPVFDQYCNYLENWAASRGFVVGPCDFRAFRNERGIVVGDDVAVAAALYTWAAANHALSRNGFTTVDPVSASFGFLFNTVTLRAKRGGLSTGAVIDLEKESNKLTQTLSRGLNMPVTVASRQFVEAQTEVQGRRGLLWSMWLGIVCVALFANLATCSALLTVVVVLTVGGSVVATLAFVTVAGFEPGAVEQACASIIMGLAVGHTIHMALGYMDFLHATQSHLFARDTTQLQAYRGTLARTGAAVVTSSAVLAVVALLFLLSPVQALVRMAQLSLVMAATSVLFALLGLGAWLCVLGPTTSLRSVAVGMIILVMWLHVLVPGLIVLLVVNPLMPDGSSLR